MYGSISINMCQHVPSCHHLVTPLHTVSCHSLTLQLKGATIYLPPVRVVSVYACISSFEHHIQCLRLSYCPLLISSADDVSRVTT